LDVLGHTEAVGFYIYIYLQVGEKYWPKILWNIFFIRGDGIHPLPALNVILKSQP